MDEKPGTDIDGTGPVPGDGEENNAPQEGEQADGTGQAGRYYSRKSCDERTYEAIYQAWKNETKVAKVLAKRFGLSDDTVSRFINKGLPRQGRQSFRVKLQLETKTYAAASEKAAEKIAEEMVGEHREIRKQTMYVAKAGRLVLANLIERIIGQVKTNNIPATRHVTRLVKVGEGPNQQLVREDYERPMDLYEVGQVMQKIAGGLSQLSKVEIAALGIEDAENPLAGLGEEEQLTLAEAKYIVDSGGKLPEGMTPEELIRRSGLNYGLIMGSTQAKAKRDLQQ